MANVSQRASGAYKRLIDWVTPGDASGAPNYYGEHVGVTFVGPTGKVETATLTADVTADDSDKTITVPASTIWQPLALYVTLTTTADAGDRQLAVLFTTAADVVIAQVRPQVVQAASLARYYSIALGNPDDLAFYDTDLLRTPMPLLVLPAGYKIRVFDNNAIAAAADDMLLQLTVLAR